MKYILLGLILIPFKVYPEKIAPAEKTANLKCSQKPGYKIDLNPATHFQKSRVKTPNVDKRLKTLQHSTTQDQNSYGLCYANSASLMLQAYLGHPVSAHHIALLSSLNSGHSRYALFDFIQDSKTRRMKMMFNVEGGDTCEAINKIVKDRSKLCDTRLVALENLDPTNNQSQILYKKLAVFYLTFSPTSKEKEALKVAAQKAKESTYPTCSDEKLLEENATGVVKRIMKSIRLKLLENCKRNHLSQINNCLKSFDKILSIKPNQQPEVSDQIDLDNSEQVNQNIQKFITSLKGKSFKTQESKVGLTEMMFENILDPIVAEMDLNNKFFPNGSDPSTFYKDYFKKLTNEDIINLTSYSDKKVCRTYEKLKIYEEVFDGICESNSNLVKIFKEIKSTSAHFFGDPEFIGATLDSLSSNVGALDFLQHLVGDECLKQGRELPKDLSCKKIKFPKRFKRSFFQSSKENIRNSKNASAKIFRNHIYEQLNKESPYGPIGNPVSIDVCTTFMDKKGFDFNWGKPKVTKEKCAQSKRDGLHAMVITGMRCKNGKVQYKVQNSWGKDATYKNPDLEVVEGQGSFWVSEKDLVNNVFSINTLQY